MHLHEVPLLPRLPGTIHQTNASGYLMWMDGLYLKKPTFRKVVSTDNV